MQSWIDPKKKKTQCEVCLPQDILLAYALYIKKGTSNAYVVFTLTMLDKDLKKNIFWGIEKLYE